MKVPKVCLCHQVNICFKKLITKLLLIRFVIFFNQV